MGAPPVDWEQNPTPGATYRPPSYAEHRQGSHPQYPPQPAPGYAEPPAQYPPAQYPPAQYPANQYSPTQYPPAQYPPTQYPPAQYPPTQYPSAQYPSAQYSQTPPAYQPPPAAPGYPGQYPPQQYPEQPGYPQQNRYGAPPPGYPQQYPYGAQPPGYPGQPPYPPYGVPPAQAVPVTKQPGGILAVLSLLFGMGAMVNIMVGNLIFTGSVPVPCLILALVSSIIGVVLGAAAWAKGNKAGRNGLGFCLMWLVVTIVIGLMWAAVFG